jgi:hypothetical protein
MESTPDKKTKKEPENSHFACSGRNFRITAGFLFLIVSAELVAQPGLTIYADAGKNNASGGLFIRSAAMANYEFGKNMIETGFLFGIKNACNSNFSGFNINASREFSFRGCLFHLQGFYTWKDCSEILCETNWGALLDMRHKRFEMAIGTNFRTYAFKPGAINEYGIKKDAGKFHENFNMMYSIGYYIKPTDDSWNAGLAITNFDSFIIEQGVNPALRLRGLYKPGRKVCLYAEAWYMPAGLLNLSMNHFGFNFKTGISWNF